MSATFRLHHKFRNNFRELHYRGGIFAKFAVGNGEWQSFALLTEWQVNKLLYAIQHSQSAHAIKGVARMPLNAIKELL